MDRTKQQPAAWGLPDELVRGFQEMDRTMQPAYRNEQEAIFYQSFGKAGKSIFHLICALSWVVYGVPSCSSGSSDSD
jgi:hypothetical protein